VKRSLLLGALLLLPAVPPRVVAQQSEPARVDAYVQRWHEVGRFNGIVLVARGDSVLYERGFGLANREWDVPNTPDTKFDIGSITKQFTTVMVFQLVAEGRLRLEDRLTDHIPEYRRDTGDRVTIDHLLRQTSGIPDYVRDWQSTAEERARGDPGPLREHLRPEFLIRAHMSRDLLFEPGSRYSYSNSNHYLLRTVIERATGRSFEQNLRERILEPLRLTGTGLLRHERAIPRLATGYVRIPLGDGRAPYFYMPSLWGTGGIYSTARDLHRWNRALEGGPVVPDSLRPRLFTPYGRDEEAERSYSMDHFTLRLGDSGTVVPYTGFSGGADGFRANAFRFPTTGHIIVILDNSEQYEHWRIAPGIFRILAGESVEQPQELSAAVVAREALSRGIDAALSRYADMRAHPGRWGALDLLESDLDEYAGRYRRIGRGDEAIAVRLLSTRLFPASAAGWQRLGDTYARLGDSARAAEASARAEALVRRERQLVEMLDRGAYDAARERVREIRRGGVEEPLFTPSNIGPRFGRAMQAESLGVAQRIAEVWALGNPADLGPQFSLANVFRATGRNERAIECYRRVLELAPEGPAADRARREIAALRGPP